MSLRGFNWPIWAGFLLSPVVLLSYPLVFERWPVTRDVPWVNLLLLGLAAGLLVAGLRRAFAPGRLRALRIVTSLVLAGLSTAVLANFLVIVFVSARQLPASAAAPQLGQRAPDFSLPDENGRSVSLSQLLATPIPSGTSTPSPQQPPRGVLLIFYMYSGCRACNSEFRGLQQHLDQFTAMGVRPVAISIDPPDVSRRLSQEAGYTFTFLSDPTLDVIRRYDVAEPGGVARPAEFLLDATGTVRWRNLTTNMFVRPRPAQMLDAAKALP
jgi:peroxiredoxin